VKLRARWGGTPPKVDDYLMSPTRPRFAYRIRDVAHRDSLVRWDPELKQEVQQLTITAERSPISSVPKNARVHPWRWDKRESRRIMPRC
jgi:hypothetical protein